MSPSPFLNILSSQSQIATMSSRGGARGRSGRHQTNTLDRYARGHRTAADVEGDRSSDEEDDKSNGAPHMSISEKIMSQSADFTRHVCLERALQIAFGGDDEDEEMQADSVLFSLTCPFSKQRITEPVSYGQGVATASNGRSSVTAKGSKEKQCCHIQCVDMTSVYAMFDSGKQMRDPKAYCPICYKLVRLSEMFYNCWMKEIIDSFPDADKVMLKPNGEVSSVYQDRKKQRVEVIDVATQEFYNDIVVKTERGLSTTPHANTISSAATNLLGVQPSSSLLSSSSAAGGSGGGSLMSYLGQHQQRQSDGNKRLFSSEGSIEEEEEHQSREVAGSTTTNAINGGVGVGAAPSVPLHLKAPLRDSFDDVPPPPPLSHHGGAIVGPPTSNLPPARDLAAAYTHSSIANASFTDEPFSPLPMAVATFEGVDPATATAANGFHSSSLMMAAGATSPPPAGGNGNAISSLYSVIPTPSGAHRLNRGLIDRQWHAVCEKCGQRCTEQHDPETGVVEMGCCGVIKPRALWPLERTVGPIALRLLPDDILLVMGEAADAFGSKLIRASFWRADSYYGHYYGYICSFGRFELDYLFALCNASAGGAAACAAISPVPELFRDWVPRPKGSSSRWSPFSQQPSLTPAPMGFTINAATPSSHFGAPPSTSANSSGVPRGW